MGGGGGREDVTVAVIRVTGQRHADCVNLAGIGSSQDSRLIKCLSIAEGG